VRGRIIESFGARVGGLHNDGINIAARKGASIRAAENGVVAYTGNQLQGFGNLVLLKHAGGWMTAYAHSSIILVKRGDVVRRGQTIAKVGRTGNVSTPQLHFELRRGERAVNPKNHLVRIARLMPVLRQYALKSE
jgi:murein DD-endopeptidase MepM/ murein hydrolase activator NlpD